MATSASVATSRIWTCSYSPDRSRRSPAATIDARRARCAGGSAAFSGGDTSLIAIEASARLGPELLVRDGAVVLGEPVVTRQVGDVERPAGALEHVGRDGQRSHRPPDERRRLRLHHVELPLAR